MRILKLDPNTTFDEFRERYEKRYPISIEAKRLEVMQKDFVNAGGQLEKQKRGRNRRD